MWIMTDWYVSANIDWLLLLLVDGSFITLADCVQSPEFLHSLV